MKTHTHTHKKKKDRKKRRHLRKQLSSQVKRLLYFILLSGEKVSSLFLFIFYLFNPFCFTINNEFNTMYSCKLTLLKTTSFFCVFFILHFVCY